LGSFVVMISLKSAWYGIVFSPSLIISWPPDLNFCWSKMGSSAASSVSPMFSNSAHLPKRTACSSVLKKFFSESEMTSKPFLQHSRSRPRLRTKRFA